MFKASVCVCLRLHLLQKTEKEEITKEIVLNKV